MRMREEGRNEEEPASTCREGCDSALPASFDTPVVPESVQLSLALPLALVRAPAQRA